MSEKLEAVGDLARSRAVPSSMAFAAFIVYCGPIWDGPPWVRLRCAHASVLQTTWDRHRGGPASTRRRAGNWELGAGSWELGRRVRSLATSRNVEHPTAALTRANSWIGWKRALNLSGTQL